MIGTDYVGISTLVTALGTIIIGVIVAFRQNTIKGTIDRTSEQVTPSNGRKLATIIEANDLTAPPRDSTPPAA